MIYQATLTPKYNPIAWTKITCGYALQHLKTDKNTTKACSSARKMQMKQYSVVIFGISKPGYCLESY